MYIKKLTGPVVANLDEPVAETTSGKVRGVMIDGTYMFRSIRYGSAERFHSPRRADHWEGVDPCIIYKGVCPELDAPVPSDNFYVPHMFYRYDENCLTLNVWTRSMDRNRRKPVMVWLHGGGYSMGSAIELYSYDGENLAAYGDVVVVTVNHRLNVLGYIDLSAYGEEYADSGNAGMEDIVEALRWIRDNIENFGGDPQNVTIFGQSGGGGKVLSLLQMPMADGLYHKAVIQSGVSEGMALSALDQDGARELADMVLKNAGLPLSIDGVKQLEKIPYHELAAAANAAIAEAAAASGSFRHFAPVCNQFLLDIGDGSGFRKETLNIPLMVGTVFGEFSNNLACKYGEGSKNWWSDETKSKLLREKFGEEADKIADEFSRVYPEKNVADTLYIDTMFRRATLDFAVRRAELSDAPVYNYLFAFEFPFNNGSIAFHNSEIAYVFHNADYLEAYYKPGVTERLQDQVSGAWVNFAYCGNPNHKLLPKWDEVSGKDVPCMIFDEECRCEVNYDARLLELLPAGQRIVPVR